jgi:cytochrome c-type biogenesis protein CcmH
LQRRLLEDAGGEEAATAHGQPARRSALFIGLSLPIAAALLYFALGNLPALSPEGAQPPKVTAQQIEEMVAKLAERMEQNPEADPKGWVMLARSYKAMGRYEEATRAFGKAGKLVDEDPHLLSEHAEALALATGGSLRGRPSELLGPRPQARPGFPRRPGPGRHGRLRAGGLRGGCRLLGTPAQALPPESEDAQSLAESIKKARAAAQKQGRKKSPAGKP